MTKYVCEVDHQFDEELEQAGNAGDVQVHSCIGWISLSEEEYTYTRAACTYRINPDAGDKYDE